MAKKPDVTDSHTDTMGVLGQSDSTSALYSALGNIPAGAETCAQCPQVVHECEVSRRLEQASPCQCRRTVKRTRSTEEIERDSSSPKRFIGEEIVASHLQQLHLTSHDSTFPPSSPLLSSTSALPPHQPLSIADPSSFSSSLLSIPLLSSADCSSLLASVARSHPLSMKTVASCSRLQEPAGEGTVCEEEDQMPMADVSPLITGFSSSDRTTPLVATCTCSSLTNRLDNQLSSTLGRTSDENGTCMCLGRTSPPCKRPAAVLNECGDIDDLEVFESDGREGVRGESWRWKEGVSLLVGPSAKRSKVDLSCIVTSTTDTMNFDPVSADTMLSRVTSDNSEPPSRCPSLATPTNTSSSKETVVEDDSDSSDDGASPSPEKPLSLWLSPELRAISDSCSGRGPSKLLLPPSILERYHKPKGMELVPWVGGPTVVAGVKEKLTGPHSNGNTHTVSLEDSDKELGEQRDGERATYPLTQSEANPNELDISMEP